MWQASAAYAEDTMCVLRSKHKTVALVGVPFDAAEVTRRQVRDVLEKVRPERAVVGLSDSHAQRIMRDQGRSLAGLFISAYQRWQVRKGAGSDKTGSGVAMRCLMQMNVQVMHDYAMVAAAEECAKLRVPVVGGYTLHDMKDNLQKSGVSENKIAQMRDAPAEVEQRVLQVLGGELGLTPTTITTRAEAAKLLFAIRAISPFFDTIFVQQRGRIMCESIWNCPGSVVVAVVNLMFMDTIESAWKQKR